MTPEQAKLLLPYEEYRLWWAAHVRRPDPDTPELGALPLSDELEG